MYNLRFLISAAALALSLIAPVAPAQNTTQNISVVSGNGQLICNNCLSSTNFQFQQLVVKVTDANGNPVSGATVNWNTPTAPVGSTLLAGNTTTTGVDGTTSNTFFVPLGIFNSDAFHAFAQYVVTASTATSTATFYLTQAFQDAPNATGFSLTPVQVRLKPDNQIPLGGPLSGQIGSTISPTFQLFVIDEHGNVVPNVAMFLSSTTDPTQGPGMECATQPGAGTNTVLTDSTGLATCTPIIVGVPGTSQIFVNVGGVVPAPGQPPTFYWQSLSPITLTATPGVPGSIKIVQGNNQTANAGQALGSTLIAEVDSTGGQPLGGAAVNWTVTPAGAATLSNSSSTSDQNGQVTTNVTLANVANGTVQVKAAVASDATKSVTFTITAVPIITVTGFQIISGNGQITPVNTQFAQPLVVQVTTTNGTVANVPVQFSSTGPVTLSATSVATDSNGRAQVTATAGSITGAVTVTATVASGSGIGTQSFNLTVVSQAPSVTSNNFVNGADLQRNSLSPCSLGAVVGPNGFFGIPAISAGFPGQPVASPVQLNIGGLNATILGVSNNSAGQQQITFQVPCEASAGASVPVTFGVGGGTTNLNIALQPASPGVFQTLGSDGVLRAVIIRPDGTFASPSNPARLGETEVALVTGLGPTTPPVGTGAVPQPGTTATVQGTVVVGMQGGGVPLVSATLSPDMPGVYLVTFQIPSGIATGDDTFSIGLIPAGSNTALYSVTTKIPVR